MLTHVKDVTIAGIQVKGQEIALVDRAYWRGHNATSGLVGLAYSLLTSAYIDDDGALDDGSRVPYSPIVTSMITQGLNPPLFSLSLTRAKSNNGPAGGYLTFGALPPVAVDPAAFASTPIVPWQYSRDSPAENLSYYSILPEAYVYNGMNSINNSTELHAIVDSGAPALYVSITILPAALRSY